MAIVDPAGVVCFGRAVTAQNSGDSFSALSCLSEAAEHAEAVFRAASEQAESEGTQDPRRTLAMADGLKALSAHLVGILQLRTNICGTLGRSEDVARDEQRIKSLSVDGNLTACQPYDLPTAVERVADWRGGSRYAWLSVLPAA